MAALGSQPQNLLNRKVLVTKFVRCDSVMINISVIQPRESKLRTKDNAQAHKSSSEFEITALL